MNMRKFTIEQLKVMASQKGHRAGKARHELQRRQGFGEKLEQVVGEMKEDTAIEAPVKRPRKPRKPRVVKEKVEENK